ncbi:homoserine kinase [Patescibacteria group bacterium]|nr:homoserine kinase [Patescibacteria group bacterium]
MKVNPVKSSHWALKPVFAKKYKHSFPRQAVGHSVSNGVNHSTLNNFLRQYNVGSLLSFKKFKKGLANQVYHLKTTKRNYTFKIIIRHAPAKIKYEIDLLNHLKNLPTAKPIKNINGKYLTKFNNQTVLLYSYLKGEEKVKFSDKMISQTAIFLAKLHLQTENFQTKVKRLEFYNISKNKLELILKVSQKLKTPSIKSALNYIEQNFLKYKLPGNLPKGAMHIDLKPENTLFVKNKLTGVVDFDNSYNGPLVLDLANTMMWYCSKEGNFNLKRAKIIYDSYNKIRKLTTIEKKYLFKALHFAFLSHVLVDIYFLALKKLPQSYINWGLKNLLLTEKNLKISKQKFSKIFN